MHIYANKSSWNAFLHQIESDSSDLALDVDLSHNELDDEGMIELCQALNKNHTITALNLSYNNISEVGIRALKEAIKNHPALTVLDLERNVLGNEGAKIISSLLLEIPALCHLNLKNNCISTEGISAVCDALVTNANLLSLDISGNSILGRGIEAVQRLIWQNKKIVNLNLGGGYGPDSLKTFFKAITNNDTLMTLNVHDPKLDDAFDNSFEAEVGTYYTHKLNENGDPPGIDKHDISTQIRYYKQLIEAKMNQNKKVKDNAVSVTKYNAVPVTKDNAVPANISVRAIKSTASFQEYTPARSMCALAKEISHSKDNYVLLRLWEPKISFFESIFGGGFQGHLSMTIHHDVEEIYVSHGPISSPSSAKVVRGENYSLKDDLLCLANNPTDYVFIYGLDIEKLLQASNKATPFWSSINNTAIPAYSSSGLIYELLKEGGLFRRLLSDEDKLIEPDDPLQVFEIAKKARNIEKNIYPITSRYTHENLEFLGYEAARKGSYEYNKLLNQIPDYFELYKKINSVTEVDTKKYQDELSKICSEADEITKETHKPVKNDVPSPNFVNLSPNATKECDENEVYNTEPNTKVSNSTEDVIDSKRTTSNIDVNDDVTSNSYLTSLFVGTGEQTSTHQKAIHSSVVNKLSDQCDKMIDASYTKLEKHENLTESIENNYLDICRNYWKNRQGFIDDEGKAVSIEEVNQARLEHEQPLANKLRILKKLAFMQLSETEPASISKACVIDTIKSMNSTLRLVTPNSLCDTGFLAEEKSLANAPSKNTKNYRFINQNIQFYLAARYLLDSINPVNNKCELFLNVLPPQSTTIQQLAMTYNTAYIRTGDQLFYVDKEKNLCRLIDIKPGHLRQFDTEMGTSKLKENGGHRILKAEELKRITSITDFSPVGYSVKRTPNKTRIQECLTFIKNNKYNYHYRKLMRLLAKLASRGDVEDYLLAKTRNYLNDALFTFTNHFDLVGIQHLELMLYVLDELWENDDNLVSELRKEIGEWLNSSIQNNEDPIVQNLRNRLCNQLLMCPKLAQFYYDSIQKRWDKFTESEKSIALQDYIIPLAAILPDAAKKVFNTMNDPALHARYGLIFSSVSWKKIVGSGFSQVLLDLLPDLASQQCNQDSAEPKLLFLLYGLGQTLKFEDLSDAVIKILSQLKLYKNIWVKNYAIFALEEATKESSTIKQNILQILKGDNVKDQLLALPIITTLASKTPFDVELQMALLDFIHNRSSTIVGLAEKSIVDSLSKNCNESTNGEIYHLRWKKLHKYYSNIASDSKQTEVREISENVNIMRVRALCSALNEGGHEFQHNLNSLLQLEKKGNLSHILLKHFSLADALTAINFLKISTEELFYAFGHLYDTEKNFKSEQTTILARRALEEGYSVNVHKNKIWLSNGINCFVISLTQLPAHFVRSFTQQLTSITQQLKLPLQHHQSLDSTYAEKPQITRNSSFEFFKPYQYDQFGIIPSISYNQACGSHKSFSIQKYLDKELSLLDNLKAEVHDGCQLHILQKFPNIFKKGEYTNCYIYAPDPDYKSKIFKNGKYQLYYVYNELYKKIEITNTDRFNENLSKFMKKEHSKDLTEDQLNTLITKNGGTTAHKSYVVKKLINKSILQIRLKSGHVTPPGFHEILKEELVTQSWTTLDLSHNKLNDDDIDKLKGILCDYKNLRTLRLSHNCITTKGFYHLLLALMNAPSIKYLLLDHNFLSGSKFSIGVEKYININDLLYSHDNYLDATGLIHIDLSMNYIPKGYTAAPEFSNDKQPKDAENTFHLEDRLAIKLNQNVVKNCGSAESAINYTKNLINDSLVIHSEIFDYIPENTLLINREETGNKALDIHGAIYALYTNDNLPIKNWNSFNIGGHAFLVFERINPDYGQKELIQADLVFKNKEKNTVKIRVKYLDPIEFLEKTAGLTKVYGHSGFIGDEKFNMLLNHICEQRDTIGGSKFFYTPGNNSSEVNCFKWAVEELEKVGVETYHKTWVPNNIFPFNKFL